MTIDRDGIRRDANATILAKPHLAAVARAEDCLALLAELEHAVESAKGLCRWTHHHSACARTVEAGECDCGLNDAWKALTEWEHE